MPDRDRDALLADLDPAQRVAVAITSGPLCILAGAGSGKTRVISRRVAYALATDVVRPRDVLVVTERAVFRLQPEGLELIEVAPGIDMQRDVLGRMEFQPLIHSVRPMPAHVFRPAEADTKPATEFPT